MINSKRTKKIIKISFLGLILFITYFPLFIIALQSFNSVQSGVRFGNFTFDNYTNMLNDRYLMSAIQHTILIAVLSTIISTIFGTLAAIGIHGLNKKPKKLLMFLNNIPIINADIVTGIFLLILFNLFGSIFGIKYITGFETLLIAHILFSTPYVILSVLPKLNETDKNLLDAALDLGCNHKRALFKILIPSIKSGIIVGAFFAFTMSIDDFVISYFNAGEIQNFSIWLYTSLSRGDPWPKAYAYNTIIMFISIVGLIVFTKIKSKEGKVK